MKFTPEGNVTMCCFQERKCLGNILETSLEDIWNGALAQEIRKETSEGELHVTCNVNSCPFSKIKKQSMHEVFLQKFPREIEIDLPTQHCNIGGATPSLQNAACIMCERHYKKPEEFYQEDRLEEICKKIKPYMKHVHWIHVQGVAEPFWKDRIFEILEWLIEPDQRHKICISTTTNGTLMNERHRKMFMEYPRSSITWSLDAGSSLIYKIIRRVDMYDRIIENMKSYAKEKSAQQHIHIHNNINTINIVDVENMVRVAAEIGVDRLDFNATYDIPSICVNSENAHIFYQAQKDIILLSKELGVFTTFMRDLTLDICDPPSVEEIEKEYQKRNLI